MIGIVFFPTVVDYTTAEQCLRLALMLILSRTECTGIMLRLCDLPGRASCLRQWRGSVTNIDRLLVDINLTGGNLRTANMPFINSLRPAPTRPNRPTILHCEPPDLLAYARLVLSQHKTQPLLAITTRLPTVDIADVRPTIACTRASWSTCCISVKV